MMTGPWRRKPIYDWTARGRRWVYAAEVGATDPGDDLPADPSLHSQIAEEAYRFLLENGPSTVTSIAEAIEPFLFQDRERLRIYLHWHLWNNPSHFEVIGEIIREGYARPVKLWSARVGELAEKRTTAWRHKKRALA